MPYNLLGAMPNTYLKRITVSAKEALAGTFPFNDKGINLDEALSGPSALAYGADQLSAIKTLSKFAKANKNLEIKMGYVDKEVADLNKINSLASLPSREELLTMVAGGMIGIVRNLAIGLDLVSKQKENN